MTAADDRAGALEQWFTPEWVAEALLDQFYPALGMHDRVLEPACGEGAFLRALPSSVQALGVEIDAELAARARASSGRPVVVGDFATAPLTFAPTLVVGNPPFRGEVVDAFLARAWELLPDEGQVGFILPAYAFQTANRVEALARRWSIAQDMIPRNVFPRIMAPLCFARLTKGPRRGLVGFALYHEAAAVQRLQARYRALLAQGERSVWAAVTRAAVEALGGRATLDAIYREVQGHRPTRNRFWQAKVRQQLQRIGYRVGPGVWAVAP